MCIVRGFIAVDWRSWCWQVENWRIICQRLSCELSGNNVQQHSTLYSTFITYNFWLLPFGKSAKYCHQDISVSAYLSVCLSASISQNPDVQTSLNFRRMLPMVYARSFSDGVWIRYVFPVLWMTSCTFARNGPVRWRRGKEVCMHKVTHQSPGGSTGRIKSDVYDCLVGYVY